MKNLWVLMYMLFTLFVGLKLTGHIVWSWWWIFAPLWGPAALQFTIGFVRGFWKAYRLRRAQRKIKTHNASRSIN